MTPAPLLLIHAGLRPGELILAHADRSSPVFLPPTDRVHRFEVGKNTQLEEWALLRRYVSGGEPDALLTFANESDAQRAVEELHKALLEPAPAAERQRLLAPIFEHWRAMVATGIFLALIAGLSYCGKHAETPHSAAPTSSDSLSSLVGYPVSGPLPPSEANPAAAPDTGAAPTTMSAGDAILQQIQQSAPSAQTAPAAPATPGDALLQQIQGH